MAFGGGFSASTDTWDQTVLANAKYDFVEMHYYPEALTGINNDSCSQPGPTNSERISLLRERCWPQAAMRIPIYLGEFDRDAIENHATVSIVNRLFNAIAIGEVAKAGVTLATQWQG